MYSYIVTIIISCPFLTFIKHPFHLVWKFSRSSPTPYRKRMVNPAYTTQLKKSIKGDEVVLVVYSRYASIQ